MAANFLQQLPKLPNFGKFPVPGKLPGLYRPKKSIPEHQAMVQRQASMSLVAPHGLQNLTGENNCFLNSAIQVLWHIDVFRRSFRELEGHTCVGKSCIFCALKDLFTQFQHSQQTTIPPDVLRHALAECYREKHRFQLNLMDDAAECFEKLLEQVHFHLTGNDDLDSCGASFCISHQCFALNILERTECVCGATSEPLSFVQFVHYISSSALVKEAQKYLGPGDDTHSPADTPTNTESGRPRRNSATSTFGKILHAASSYGEYRECPNFAHCKKNVAVKRILLNCPDVVCLGLIWDSDQPPVDDIMAVVNNIGLTLQLSDVFDTVSAENAHFNEYQLTAAIAYYGRHYSTFCHHSRKREWIYFDDANFRTIGPEWSDVCDVIRKAHYQPLLLVYSNPFAENIDTSQAPKNITRIFPHSRRKIVPSRVNENDATEEENSKTSSGEHTVIPNPSAVTSTPDSEQKPIQNGSSDFDSTPIKSSTPVNPVKPPAPTEVINPMTFSIMPASVPHLAHTPENNRKTETTSSKPSDPMSLLQDEGDMSGSSNYPANVRAQPSGVEMSSASDNEPVADLMMFSLTPSAMARIRSTPVFCSPGQGQVMHTSPASQPDLSKVNEVTQSTNEDLIEFSINPNFVRNAHSSSKGPYDFSTTNRGSRSLSSSPHPPRAKSPGMHSPELHTSRRSPEPSSRYLLTTDQQQKNSPQDQEKNQEIKNATNFATIGEPQSAQKTPTPPFQRQTSFPFQNKQPAVLESKTDVHALPQSSDFANRFPTLDDGEDDSRGDLLKPDWKHFAENENASSSEFFSTSPERWTVLSATGEEEATFKPERQFSEDFVSTTTTSISESDERTASSEATSEEIKHTPAITSLKRVANYAPEKPAKPVSPVAGRPLPSVPYGDSATSQPTTLPLSYNDRGLPTSLGSPMAHLSPNSSTAKFLAHPNHGSNAISSSTSRSAAPPNTTKPASKTKYDPEYADPDDLVFCKPNSSQQWSAHTGSLYGQKRQDVASKSNAQGGRNGSDDHEYFVEVETVTYKSNAKSAEQPGSARESSKNEEFSGDIKSGSDGRKDGSGGSAADRNSEFSSPPISADPLYALPEKLKIKFATQGATTSASSTTAENRTTPVETPLSSVASASSISSVTAASSTGGQRPSKPAASTGAEYLTLLLQERQSARQQTSANLTTPTGDLLEASTKARAGSNIDLSPTTVRDGTISIGGSIVSTASLKTRHRSGKEYLAELLQRRAKQQSVEQSSNAGLHVAGQTPKYPMSNSSNVHASPSGALGSNPRHTVASESRVSASQPAHTEKQSSSTGKVRSTVQPLYHGSNPVGPGSHSSSGGVSSGRHVGASNVQRVDRVTDTGAHKTTSEATSQRQFAAQKRTQGPASKAVMPAIPEHIHSRLLEARDIWAKAEASLPSDTAVAYMLFTQHNGILARVLQDPAVKANPPLHQHVSNIKGEGSRRAMAVKSSITSATPTATTRSSQGACQRCGNVRNLDSNNLCGPCQLRAQIGK